MRLKSLLARLERRVGRAVLNGPLVPLLARSRGAPREGRRIDPQLAAMLALGDLLGESGAPRGEVAQIRAQFRHSSALVAPEPPEGVRTERFVLRGASDERPCALHVPPDLSRPAPLVFYVHGGGFVTGDLDSHGPFCAWLASRARCLVLAVTYRRAPEHKFPAAVHDVDALFRGLPAHASRLGFDPARVVVAGDSAGGNLCAVLARHVRGEAFVPRAQFLIYPATDFTKSLPSHRTFGDAFLLTSESIDWYRDAYLRGEADWRDPDASCLFAEDLAGVAPAVVYTAGFDPLIDEGEAYADRLRDAGVPVRVRRFEDLTHGFAGLGGAITAAQRAIDEIYADVTRELREPGSATRAR